MIPLGGRQSITRVRIAVTAPEEGIRRDALDAISVKLRLGHCIVIGPSHCVSAFHSRDRSGERRRRTARQPSLVQCNHSLCGLYPPACGMRRPARGGRRRLRSVWACASHGSIGAGHSDLGHASGVARRKLPVNLANIQRLRMFRHEQRKLLALVERGEVHGGCSTFVSGSAQGLSAAQQPTGQFLAR